MFFQPIILLKVKKSNLYLKDICLLDKKQVVRTEFKIMKEIINLKCFKKLKYKQMI